MRHAFDLFLHGRAFVRDFAYALAFPWKKNHGYMYYDSRFIRKFKIHYDSLQGWGKRKGAQSKEYLRCCPRKGWKETRTHAHRARAALAL